MVVLNLAVAGSLPASLQAATGVLRSELAAIAGSQTSRVTLSDASTTRPSPPGRGDDLNPAGGSPSCSVTSTASISRSASPSDSSTPAGGSPSASDTPSPSATASASAGGLDDGGRRPLVYLVARFTVPSDSATSSALAAAYERARVLRGVLVDNTADVTRIRRALGSTLRMLEDAAMAEAVAEAAANGGGQESQAIAAAEAQALVGIQVDGDDGVGIQARETAAPFRPSQDMGMSPAVVGSLIAAGVLFGVGVILYLHRQRRRGGRMLHKLGLGGGGGYSGVYSIPKPAFLRPLETATPGADLSERPTHQYVLTHGSAATATSAALLMGRSGVHHHSRVSSLSGAGGGGGLSLAAAAAAAGISGRRDGRARSGSSGLMSSLPPIGLGHSSSGSGVASGPQALQPNFSNTQAQLQAIQAQFSQGGHNSNGDDVTGDGGGRNSPSSSSGINSYAGFPTAGAASAVHGLHGMQPSHLQPVAEEGEEEEEDENENEEDGEFTGSNSRGGGGSSYSSSAAHTGSSLLFSAAAGISSDGMTPQHHQPTQQQQHAGAASSAYGRSISPSPHTLHASSSAPSGSASSLASASGHGYGMATSAAGISGGTVVIANQLPQALSFAHARAQSAHLGRSLTPGRGGRTASSSGGIAAIPERPLSIRRASDRLSGGGGGGGVRAHLIGSAPSAAEEKPSLGGAYAAAASLPIDSHDLVRVATMTDDGQEEGSSVVMNNRSDANETAIISANDAEVLPGAGTNGAHSTVNPSYAMAASSSSSTISASSSSVSRERIASESSNGQLQILSNSHRGPGAVPAQPLPSPVASPSASTNASTAADVADGMRRGNIAIDVTEGEETTAAHIDASSSTGRRLDFTDNGDAER